MSFKNLPFFYRALGAFHCVYRELQFRNDFINFNYDKIFLTVHTFETFRTEWVGSRFNRYENLIVAKF